jgi:hypothetical protein
MHLWLLVLLLFSLHVAAEALPRIGLIEFYGLKQVKREALASVIGIGRGDWIPVNFDPKVAENEVRQAFGIPDNAPLPQSEGEILRRLKSVKGVHQAKLAAICCEPDATTTLFVGIQEKPGTLFEYRKPGQKQIMLPAAMLSLYDRYTEALSEAVRKGTVLEDDREGHALFSDQTLRNFTREFLAYARENTPLLAEVLNESSDAKQRTAAAWDHRLRARQETCCGSAPQGNS